MENRNYYYKMTRIYEHLQDEESRKLFEARVDFLIDRDKDAYLTDIAAVYQDWYGADEIKRQLAERSFDEIIIFGCSYLGIMLKGLLRCIGYRAVYFCDNNHSGTIVEDLPVLSLDDIKKEHCKNSLIMIASYGYQDEMHRQLRDMGIPEELIFQYKNIELFGKRGSQYFDVFAPSEKEVFVDAGAFDGETIRDFCKWTKGVYKKIYAFEPIAAMCDKIQKDVENSKIQHVQLINAATWDKKETIRFDDDGSSSCINDNGSVVVQGADIDSVVKDETVTYIKMDIEGSELKALQGAKKTIIRNRPRLAICIYHKPEDIIEIPSYILELVPEYKFYIRHYTAHMWETVLYAVAEEF